MAADKFGIDPLKDLARGRLASWLKSNWRKEVFPKVARSVLQSVPPQESHLPDIVANFISKNADYLLRRESTSDILGEFGGLTVAVLKDVAGSLKSPRQSVNGWMLSVNKTHLQRHLEMHWHPRSTV